MEILIIITLVACVVSVITLLTQKRLAENIGVNKITDEQTAKQLEMLAERTAQLSAKFDTAQANRVSGESVLRTELVNLVTNLGNTLTDTQKLNSDGTARLLSQFEQRLQSIEQRNAADMQNMRNEMAVQLGNINANTKNQLEEMRGMVGEKLQTTLDDKISRSFATVSEQLNKVYSGLGEMQSLAAGVGDLKKVLSNVKSRGILGEMQLGAILADILTPEQYDTEVAVVPDSRNHVEFAVKLPGKNDDTVYLPIDSKFPGDTYTALCNAYDSGDKVMIEEASKALVVAIKKCAKDIHDKYVDPPFTTDFAIMFLPFESIYAEVIRRTSLVETLQKEYKIVVTGPTTLGAILNSLQMGFRTLAIQKRTGEVWTVLGAVKTEFSKFGGLLEKVQKNLQNAGDQLEEVMGKRTRAIERKLRQVEQLPHEESRKILPIEEDGELFD